MVGAVRRAALGLLPPIALAACSPAPAARGDLGPVSPPGAGKAAFNEAKATEALYRAGWRGITGLRRGPDGVWRGVAQRGGHESPVAVTPSGVVE